MRYVLLTSVACLVLAASGAAVPSCQHQEYVEATLNAQTRPKVLYLTHTAGFVHDVLPHSEQVLRALGEKQGWEVVPTKDLGLLTRASLADYAAVVFYTTGELAITDEQKQALLDYVRGGRGFVGIHSATDTFYKWPEYGQMIGGYFDGHPWHELVAVLVEDRTHPSTKHLDPTFTITDEIYQHRDWSREQSHVLMKLDPEKVDLTKKGVKRTDKDFALSWTRSYGSGRVFYTALGHRKEVWDDPRFQTHLIEGIRWSMGTKSSSATGAAKPADNEGWTSLFDGRSLEGWRTYASEQPPAGWSVANGVLARTGDGGDLMTTRTFGDFVLELDFRIAEGGNSGIMYRVTTEGERPYWSGPEYQILDNARHPDAKNGPDRLTGANYDLIPPGRNVSKPAGEWNTARIVVRGNHVEHWLNGEKVVEYEFGSPAWTRLVADSKFNAWPMYGKAPRGHIVLQDHGDHVEFRNIRINESR